MDRRRKEKGGKGFHVLLFAFGKARHLSVHQKNKLLSNIGPASTLLLYFPIHRTRDCFSDLLKSMSLDLWWSPGELAV